MISINYTFDKAAQMKQQSIPCRALSLVRPTDNGTESHIKKHTETDFAI